MYSVQPPLLALKDFLESDTNDRLVLVLGTLDLEPLLQLLDRRRGRGRRGYAVRSMLYAVIAGWVYDLHSMAELRRELRRNGSRKQPADPDARWGCKGHETKGKSKYWFGYKLHLAVCAKTELCLAFTVTPANVGDSIEMDPLLKAIDRVLLDTG